MTQTHHPISVTPEQRQNLQTLADYLLQPTINDFDMRAFRTVGFNDTGDALDAISLHQNHCGTVGCAIGHGPQAGIEPRSEDESWWGYCRRCFGADINPHNVEARMLWHWLFDDNWSTVDNTATGAAHRIIIALSKGIPDSYLHQRRGIVPLEYTP